MRLSIRSRAQCSLLLLFGGRLALGCGDGAVNLGENAPDQPVILYEGFPGTYAVDETTLYLAIGEGGSDALTITLQSCDLGACATTLHNLYQRSIGQMRIQILDHLAVLGSEIFFPLPSSTNEPGIAACPRTGCSDAPRDVTGARNVRHLVLTEEDVYWDDSYSVMRCARVGCATPASRSFEMLTNVPNSINNQLHSFLVAGDYAYIAAQFAFGRAKRDLSADPEWVYTSDVPIEGIAVAGGWVYFGISTLTGELRGCPITGCAGDPKVIASGQRWPSAIVADERNLYWLSYPADQAVFLNGTVTAGAIDGSSTPKTLASNLILSQGWPLLMNSHHVYWAERSSNTQARIWALAK